MNTLDLNPDTFFLKLGPSEKNIHYFKSHDEAGWTTIIAFNPAAQFSCSKEQQENRHTFIEQHSDKRLLGYFSYDLAYEFFNISQNADNDLKLPDIHICAFESYIIFNNNKAHIYSENPDFKKLVESIDQRELNQTISWTIDPFSSKTSQKEYKNAYDSIQKYILSGDIYQLNLTHRLESKTDLPAKELFLKVAEKNPVNFLAYIEGSGVDGDSFEIISASPERFVKIEGNNIETCPVKGTRPRGKTAAEDLLMQQDLIENEKEKAELNMITDLLRNDLGKICEINSVKVQEQRLLSAHSNVWHTHTRIIGSLNDSYTPMDALASMHPGGSITGCPKKRAIEIIDELEPITRGVYTGTIFNCDKNHTLDSSIAIRTMIKRHQHLYLQVGGGIVLDSDRDSEYQETLHKAASFLNLKAVDFFTTFRVTDGKIQYLADHLARIQHFSALQNIPIDLKALKKDVADFFVSKSGKGRIISQNNQLSFTVEPLPVQPDHLLITLKIIETPLGNIKRYPFKNQGFSEGEEIVFIQKDSNEVLEGNYTNIFIKIDDQYYTPPADGKILEGIQRKHFIKQLRAKGKVVNETKITPEMLHRGEILLTNCLKGVVTGIIQN